ncbi:hypothetical protein [Lampropedia aestuarii]|uniref:hypothetical protein n=1 Tax=Lampropedia aestuarii TaxID=2562762 RepID=UPI002468B99C|nr:hypothetical protein [Lampropedia aestuarii]MDH5859288.1 hypothetical protein [Lampropedia aestuarii]
MNASEFLEILSNHLQSERESGLFIISHDENFKIINQEAWQSHCKIKLSIWRDRLFFLKKNNKIFYGVDELVSKLEENKENIKLLYFELLSNRYIGECYLHNEKIFGYGITTTTD